jgi:hypothetical protein
MAQGQGGRRARWTPTGLSRAVNLMVASRHHALPWHKAKGGGARREFTKAEAEEPIPRAQAISIHHQQTVYRAFLVEFADSPIDDTYSCR